MNVTLFVNRNFEGTVSYDEAKLGLIQNDWCPYKGKEFGQRDRRKDSLVMEAEI